MPIAKPGCQETERKMISTQPHCVGIESLLPRATMMEYNDLMRMKTSATKLLGRVIEPLGRCLTPAAAKEILSLHSGQVARRRIQKLAAKCDAGALTPEERAEYTLFVEVGDLVALLQAKARRYLTERRAA
jgi:hypothetical protein